MMLGLRAAGSCRGGGFRRRSLLGPPPLDQRPTTSQTALSWERTIGEAGATENSQHGGRARDGARRVGLGGRRKSGSARKGKGEAASGKVPARRRRRGVGGSGRLRRLREAPRQRKWARRARGTSHPASRAASGQPSASHHLHLARRGLTETGICSLSETGWPRGSAERGGKGVSTGPILPLVTHKSSFPSSPTLTRTLTHSDTAQPQMG